MGSPRGTASAHLDIAAGSHAVGITAGGDPDTSVFSGDLPPAADTDYTARIRGDAESTDGDVVADFDVSLDGGQVYTAFGAGYLTPDDEPADTAFDLLVAGDTAGTAG